MSQENVEVVRRVIKEFQAGMERGELGLLFDSEFVAADDFEWILVEPLDGRSVWVGPDEFIEFIHMWTEQFEDWSVQIEDVIDAGENGVVALTSQSAIGRESGVPVELKIGQVWEVEAGRAIRARNYLTHAEALEAAGLRG